MRIKYIFRTIFTYIFFIIIAIIFFNFLIRICLIGKPVDYSLRFRGFCINKIENDLTDIDIFCKIHGSLIRLPYYLKNDVIEHISYDIANSRLLRYRFDPMLRSIDIQNLDTHHTYSIYFHTPSRIYGIRLQSQGNWIWRRFGSYILTDNLTFYWNCDMCVR